MSFDVLSRDLDVHKSALLEASAGTGKTFAIEHLAVRLLLEGEALLLEQILIVTFTRAATADLKARIRSNLILAKKQLIEREPKAPDYLQKILESGEHEVSKALYKLEQALASYDQAPIFTIHGFCFRMLSAYALEADVSPESLEGERTVGQQLLIRLIKDAFRTRLSEENFSKEQLKIVLRRHRDLDTLCQALLPCVLSGDPVCPCGTLTKDFSQFAAAIEILKTAAPSKEQLVEQFICLAPSFKKPCDTTPEAIAKVERLAALFTKEKITREDFDQQIRDQLYLVHALDPDLRKKRVREDQALIPSFVTKLREVLLPIVQCASGYPEIFARIAKECQEVVVKALEKEELFRFDDLLSVMQKSLEKKPFADAVRSQFRAVLVDEFQDTDPVQWHIFQTLFLSTHTLYLVGDPKQSIYAFRQADIYAYLEAARALGDKRHFSLSTNYRAHPQLVTALNLLFASCQKLFDLPKEGEMLPFQPVSASNAVLQHPFSDSLGAVHAFVAETTRECRTLEQLEVRYFFPFIAQEILRLNREDTFSFDAFAVLVADRFQAERLASFLNLWEIPTVQLKRESVVDTPAFRAVQEILEGIVIPSRESALRVALGGPLFGWSLEELETLEDTACKEQVVAQFIALKKTLVEKGIVAFFAKLWRLPWKEVTLLERLLSKEEGVALYSDCMQIAEMVSQKNQTPEQLLFDLEELQFSQERYEETYQRRLSTTDSAVKIVTIHSSKGLEFDVVFPLGVVKQSRLPDQFLHTEGRWQVILDKNSEAYQRYLAESDAEKMRQFYVAMTRAKQRLYFPVIVPSSVRGKGVQSPMELYLTKLPQQLDPFLQEVAKKSAFTYSELNQEAFQLYPAQTKEDSTTLLEPLKPTFSWEPLLLTSFTQLHRQRQGNKTVHSTKPTPQLFEETDKDVHHLPASSETGTLLHLLLEKLPFSLLTTVKAAEQLIPYIHPFISKMPFASWDAVIAKLLYTSFHTPLPSLGEPFLLADVSPDEIFREMEFLYREEKSMNKGVIDLIFSYKNRYYLLDWKSNWLGENEEAYTEEHLKEAMKEHDYFLQASLYQEALKRYLAVVDPRPFEECFGGTYYLFLRGTPKGGVYWIDP